jgi:hypothetical protein
MRTFKRIWIIFAIAAGLMMFLTGCNPYKSYYAQGGLDITIQGRESSRSTVVIKTDDGEVSKNIGSVDDLRWYYDVSDDQPEYVIVEQSQYDNSAINLHIHRWINKKPVNFKK